MTTRILLTGSMGQVGWELQRTLAPLGEVIAPSRADLDLSIPDTIKRVIRQVKPAIIINPAAYTAVDHAETEAELAYAVNAVAPEILAQEAKRCGAFLVHFSTDYVFDGRKSSAYLETDLTQALGIYGETKRQGELAIQAQAVPHWILRTSWVYGRRGKNFMLTMLRLAKERSVLNVVDDQIGAPTWSRMIAEASALMLARPSYRDTTGIYHLTCSGATSWYGFAQTIIRLAADMPQYNGMQLNSECIHPIPTSSYPTPAKRPANSRLNTDKLATVFGIRLPDWRACLEMALHDS